MNADLLAEYERQLDELDLRAAQTDEEIRLWKIQTAEVIAEAKVSMRRLRDAVDRWA